MDSEVIMPRLGEEMQYGKIVEWLKKEGDQVNEYDFLFVVDTEKANIEVEALVSGTLRKILVRDPDQEVPVGETVAIIETKD